MKFQFYSEELEKIPTLSVDGIAPLGTNLSHWPNNRTKQEFKADTSTEICLNFVKHLKKSKAKPKEEILTINHYDTDGFLSLCTILFPELSLENEELIINSATTGDFCRFTNPHALKIDLTVSAFSSSPLSPLYDKIKNLDEVPKRQLLYEELFKLYPKILSNDINNFSFLWEDMFNQIMKELNEKDKIEISFYKEIDLAIIKHPAPLNDVTLTTISFPANRVLSKIYKENKVYYDFRYTVDSWFTIISRKAKKRMALGKLTKELNKIEKNNVWENDPISYPVCHLRNNAPSSIPEKTLEDKIINFL